MFYAAAWALLGLHSVDWLRIGDMLMIFWDELSALSLEPVYLLCCHSRSEQTKHHVLMSDFELRPPLPTTIFDLLLLCIWSLILVVMEIWTKLHTWIARYKGCRGCNEALPHRMHTEVILPVFFANTSIKSKNLMAFKSLESIFLKLHVFRAKRNS